MVTNSQENNAAVQRLVSDWSASARRLDAFAVAVLDQHRVQLDGSVGGLLFTYAVRMSRHFRAIHTLVEAGLNDAACGTLRCLLEQSFVFCAISEKPELMAQLVADADGESRKAISGLQNLRPDERAAELTPERIEEELALMARGGFSAYEWADRCGQIGVYLTAYRRLNTYAHGALAAINEYLHEGVQQGTLLVRGDIAADRMPIHLSMASDILMNAITTVTDGFATETQRAETIDLKAMHDDVRQRAYAMHSDTSVPL